MKKILISSFIVLVSAVVVIGATRAYFSDTETSVGNTFSAGTLDITVAPTGPQFSLGNMAPGDTETRTITVSNTGSLDMKFRGTAALTSDVAGPQGGKLADALIATVTVTSITDALGHIPAGITPPPYPIATGTLRQLATNGFGAWDSAHMPVAFGPGWTYVFDITIHFPEDAGNMYQGAGLTGDFTFDAAQWNDPVVW